MAARQNVQLGYGNLRNIGDDELPSSVGPLDVTNNPGVTVESFAAGNSPTCALLSDDSVECWGSKRFGQLGLRQRHEHRRRRAAASVGVVKLF